jgi:uncharacterized protein YidB (DUF937 family)
MSGILGRLLGALSGSEQENAGAVHGALQDVLGLNQSGGLGGLLQQFQSSGMGQHMQSWIGNGQNLPITAEEVQQVLSNDQVQALLQRTGLPIQALMPLVAKILPHAVDQATPDGQMPEGGTTTA